MNIFATALLSLSLLSGQATSTRPVPNAQIASATASVSLPAKATLVATGKLTTAGAQKAAGGSTIEVYDGQSKLTLVVLDKSGSRVKRVSVEFRDGDARTVELETRTRMGKWDVTGEKPRSISTSKVKKSFSVDEAEKHLIPLFSLSPEVKAARGKAPASLTFAPDDGLGGDDDISCEIRNNVCYCTCSHGWNGWGMMGCFWFKYSSLVHGEDCTTNQVTCTAPYDECPGS